MHSVLDLKFIVLYIENGFFPELTNTSVLNFP